LEELLVVLLMRQLLLVATTYSPVSASMPEESLADLRWFPPREVTAANLKLARQHVAFLEARNRVWPMDDLGQCLLEARALAEAWNDLAEALDPDELEYWRLEYLYWLKATLGSRAYFEGRMPPPVPLHRFALRD
jgi:hypothetical protein